MHRSIVALCASLCIAAGPGLATGAVPGPPHIDATAYILVDYQTGRVLAAKNAMEELPMASLAQLMTTYVVFGNLASGKLGLGEPVTISEHAWRQGGSRTFVQVGTRVPVRELILGMIVESGNDATVALAERVAGTEDAFVRTMNATARRLGLTRTHYADATGLPRRGLHTTARDLSLLATALIRDFPRYYHWFSVKQFEYNHILQHNRNGLLDTDPGVDGLKAGHTDAAGYCLVASQHRHGMRLISVVLGGQNFMDRNSASAVLLNYGFTFYETKLVARAHAPLATATVWKAHDPAIPVGIDRDLYVTIPRADGGALRTAVRIAPQLMGPLTPQSTIGQLLVTDHGKVIATAPLHPLVADGAGTWWRDLVDTVRLWIS